MLRGQLYVLRGVLVSPLLKVKVLFIATITIILSCHDLQSTAAPRATQRAMSSSCVRTLTGQVAVLGVLNRCESTTNDGDEVMKRDGFKNRNLLIITLSLL